MYIILQDDEIFSQNRCVNKYKQYRAENGYNKVCFETETLKI